MYPPTWSGYRSFPMEPQIARSTQHGGGDDDDDDEHGHAQATQQVNEDLEPEPTVNYCCRF